MVIVAQGNTVEVSKTVGYELNDYKIYVAEWFTN